MLFYSGLAEILVYVLERALKKVVLEGNAHGRKRMLCRRAIFGSIESTLPSLNTPLCLANNVETFMLIH